jgi:hypothetical protein
MRALAAALALGLVPSAATAGDDEAGARDTARVMIAGGVSIAASYPGSIEDPGPALAVATPLWLGDGGVVQGVIESATSFAWGTASHHAHVATSVRFGGDLYLGSVFGFEMALGPVVLAQVGRRGVLGLGLEISGGYVFRFWDDERRRVSLDLTFRGGGYLAEDEGNDLAANAAAFVVGLGYEAPY